MTHPLRRTRGGEELVLVRNGPAPLVTQLYQLPTAEIGRGDHRDRLRSADRYRIGQDAADADYRLLRH